MPAQQQQHQGRVGEQGHQMFELDQAQKGYPWCSAEWQHQTAYCHALKPTAKWLKVCNTMGMYHSRTPTEQLA